MTGNTLNRNSSEPQCKLINLNNVLISYKIWGSLIVKRETNIRQVQLPSLYKQTEFDSLYTILVTLNITGSTI